MDGGVAIVGLVVVFGLLFEFMNGFHDAANAIATVVATKITPVSTRMNRNRLSITPPWALMFSGSQWPCMGHQPAIAHTNEPTPSTGTIRNKRLQNRPTAISSQRC